MFKFLKPPHKYEDNETFYNALKAEKTDAINYLAKKVRPTIKAMARNWHLPKEEDEDLITDSIMVLLLRMSDSKYEYKGHSPATYVVEVASRIIRNRYRGNKGKLNAAMFDNDKLPGLTDTDALNYQKQKESMDALMHLINEHLGPGCHDIILYRFVYEYPDKDVIEQKLTQYQSVPAPAQCPMYMFRKIARV
jgi:DNA-directed RNA polymerase specialized sigma24 family protein